jgi:hypothetical protein
MPKIPDPEYFFETVTGALAAQPKESAPVRAGGTSPRSLTLHLGPVPDGVAPGAILFSGAVIVRYGLQTAVPPTRYLIPGLFVGERGGAVVGQKAWTYLQERWTHHPRADVVGIDPAGKQAQYFLKELDFGTPVHLFAYPDQTNHVSLGEIVEIIGIAGAALPDLFMAYRPGTRPHG